MEGPRNEADQRGVQRTQGKGGDPNLKQLQDVQPPKLAQSYPETTEEALGP